MKLMKGHKLYTKDGRICGNGILTMNAWCPDERSALNQIRMDDGKMVALRNETVLELFYLSDEPTPKPYASVG